jgi:hypothetical protein
MGSRLMPWDVRRRTSLVAVRATRSPSQGSWSFAQMEGQMIDEVVVSATHRLHRALTRRAVLLQEGRDSTTCGGLVSLCSIIATGAYGCCY